MITSNTSPEWNGQKWCSEKHKMEDLQQEQE